MPDVRTTLSALHVLSSFTMGGPVTRYEKSEAQLDAEAQRRDLPLNALIALHRAMRSDELHLHRLNVDDPPVFIDPQTGERSSEPAARIGLTLSHALTAYITSNYGVLFPWARAAWLLRVQCLREHPEHKDRSVFAGSLCSTLVRLVIRDGWDPGKAALVLDLDPARTRRTLAHALRMIEAFMDQQRERMEKREREDVGRFAWGEDRVQLQRHDQPGLHRRECPQCRKAA